MRAEVSQNQASYEANKFNYTYDIQGPVWLVFLLKNWFQTFPLQSPIIFKEANSA